MKTYVKKLTSLNPKKYKYITLKQASDDYKVYLLTYASYICSKYWTPKEKNELKTLEQWLATEI